MIENYADPIDRSSAISEAHTERALADMKNRPRGWNRQANALIVVSLSLKPVKRPPAVPIIVLIARRLWSVEDED